ncbi:hypothetical protein ACLFMI_09000 [Pseudonocardia nantongensis]|uniref:hypothetical protein n=1 Tax=Pseudonocardia nantongensis TaxID=1181885 RepID=UPI00397E3731
MSTPRRRPTGGIRKPQVAGRPRTGHADDEGTEATEQSRTGGVAVDERAAASAETGNDVTGAAPAAKPVRSGAADDDRPGRAGPSDGSASGSAPSDFGEDDAGEEDAGKQDADEHGSAGARRRFRLPPAPASRAGTAALLAVTVLLTAAAVFFGVSWYRAEFTGASANAALTDVGATAQINEQIGEAVTKVYSFDHTRLEQAEADARAVITPAFAPEFERIFGSVRELAPQQQAVVTATIPKSAVQSVQGDRASVYLFVNQVIRRQADGGAPQEGSAAARLRVEAEYLDGRWKIASMTPA